MAEEPTTYAAPAKQASKSASGSGREVGELYMDGDALMVEGRDAPLVAPPDHPVFQGEQVSEDGGEFKRSNPEAYGQEPI